MNFFRSKFFILITVSTLAIFTAMAFSTIDFRKSPLPTDAVNVLITPMQVLLSSIGNRIEGFFVGIGELGNLREKNLELIALIDNYERDTKELQELRFENEELRQLLELKQRHKDYEMVGAQITGKDPNNWIKTFLIDKGTTSGLAKNCAVMSSNGLVGHIYEIGTTWAKVITVVDPKYAASAMLVRTNDNAVIEGDLVLSKSGLCKLNYLDKAAGAVVGDYVETSGMGGIYPRGLMIGRITELRSDPQGLSNYAIVQVSVDFDKITSVMVIKPQ